MADLEVRLPAVPLFGESAPAIAELARQYLQLALSVAAGYLSEEAPVNAGHLSQSFGAYPATTDGGMELLQGSSPQTTLSGRTFSSLPYAVVMDEGRRPGQRMPPVGAIELWVQRQLGIEDPKERRAAAWAIAISMARKGIVARRFSERAARRAQPAIEDVFTGLADAAARMLTQGAP